MITIGIRAAPKAVTFAVYDTERAAVLNVEEIRIPAAFQTPEACPTSAPVGQIEGLHERRMAGSS
jgi:hypothetical protein